MNTQINLTEEQRKFVFGQLFLFTLLGIIHIPLDSLFISPLRGSGIPLHLLVEQHG